MTVELETGEIGKVSEIYKDDCEVGVNIQINIDKPDGKIYFERGVVKYIYLEDGKKYLTESRGIVLIKKSNNYNGFHYKFTVDKWIDTDDTNTTEVWNSKGIAYHNDCGYNIIKEVL